MAGAAAAAATTGAANRSRHVLEPAWIAGGGRDFDLLKMRGLSREHTGRLGRMATLLQRFGADEALQVLQVLEPESPLALGGLRPMTGESIERHKQAAVDSGVPALFDAWNELAVTTAPGISGPGRRYTHERHAAFGVGADAAVVDDLLVGAMERELDFMHNLTPRRYLSEVLIRTPLSLAGLASGGYLDADVRSLSSGPPGNPQTLAS